MATLTLLFGIVLPVLATPSAVAICLTRPQYEEIVMGTVLVIYGIGGALLAFNS